MDKISIKEYFGENSGDSPKGMANRIAKGLARNRINTMDDLLDATPGEIAGIRDIGQKRLALILLLRDKYSKSLPKIYPKLK